MAEAICAMDRPVMFRSKTNIAVLIETLVVIVKRVTTGY